MVVRFTRYPHRNAKLGRENTVGRCRLTLDPIKPTLKVPGTKRLKLKHDKLLSTFAFNFNLRRYNTAEEAAWLASDEVPAWAKSQ